MVVGLACLLNVLVNAQVMAHAIEIADAQPVLDEGVYYLDARVEYQLSKAMREGLKHGLVLQFELDIELFRRRAYVWDETVTQLVQNYQLTYLPLTRDYLLKNVNSGAQHHLPSLAVALSVMGTVVHLPLIDYNLLQQGQDYWGRIRARFDVDTLPVPLRLQSYLFMAPEWRMSSDWVTWTLTQ